MTTDANLGPDQFLYGRKGPWPQPSPSHPLIEAFEVLNVPPIEGLLWQQTIGARYLATQIGYPPAAAQYAVEQINANYLGPDDARFAQIMFETCYQRYLLPLGAADVAWLQSKGVQNPSGAGITLKYDFGAMDLVQPLAGMHCAPTRLFLAGTPAAGLQCAYISVGDALIAPKTPAWALAKAYVLQGAAYQMLFVVHPALHFPMDSVNAVTKTAVPHTHPLFQLVYPHTSYTLALDNAVLESENSVVNDHAQGTWFDPLTGNAYNLKLLFAAGYTGLADARYRGAYPAYHYLKPALIRLPGAAPQPVHDTAYSRWQTAYFTRAVLPLCQAVAKSILGADPADGYVTRWARYLHTCVNGFPDEADILDADCLALTLAIYLWDVTIAHGADHASFGAGLSPAEKFLRIRAAPPASAGSPSPTQAAQLYTGDDMARAAIANQMFFAPWTMAPNLDATWYAFTDPALAEAQVSFHAALRSVDNDRSLTQFMPLVADDCVPPPPPTTRTAPLAQTLPQSIQY